MTNIAILGSTGSIGTQTLDLVRQFPDEIRVVGLAAGQDGAKLRAQGEEFGVTNLALMHDPQGTGIATGIEAITDIATLPEADCVVVAVAGVIGLLPTTAAIRARKRIALASKEVLVAAGEVVMPLVREFGVEMVPVDSEHSAIFQCLQGYQSHQVEELILTASGGPFRGWTRDQLENVTREQTLNHPTWRMGGKITVDSATMMNKGLEIIEARWLFDVPTDQVKVVVHPQSVVHSMVKFRDGSVLGQLGWPDMRLPIAYALRFPARVPNHLRPWNPVDTPTLTFENVDENVFECLSLARESDRIGGTMPCVMNAANEEAANALLRGEIRYLDIARVVSTTMAAIPRAEATLESLLALDARAREVSRQTIESLRLL
ncbi:MAG: 1-deoxy-D-xylulose-5-phosphate reductoisomerase [Fimbriimonas sp.]